MRQAKHEQLWKMKVKDNVWKKIEKLGKTAIVAGAWFDLGIAGARFLPVEPVWPVRAVNWPVSNTDWSAKNSS